MRRALQLVLLLKHPELYEIRIEEERIARLVGKVVRESSNCVDVGSHLGMVLSLLLKQAPRGRHLAFEPNPQQAGWLQRKFPEVDVRQLALGDMKEEGLLYILEDRSGFSSLHSAGEPGERTRTVATEVARLDDIVGSDHRVDFLKVVVEGAELSVLRGGEELLRRDRPFLLFECIPVHLARFGDTPAELFAFLTERHSYAVFLIKHVLDDGPPLDLKGFEEALCYPFKALKFAASPRSRPLSGIRVGGHHGIAEEQSRDQRHRHHEHLKALFEARDRLPHQQRIEAAEAERAGDEQGQARHQKELGRRVAPACVEVSQEAKQQGATNGPRSGLPIRPPSRDPANATAEATRVPGDILPAHLKTEGRSQRHDHQRGKYHPSRQGDHLAGWPRAREEAGEVDAEEDAEDQGKEGHADPCHARGPRREVPVGQLLDRVDQGQPGQEDHQPRGHGDPVDVASDVRVGHCGDEPCDGRGTELVPAVRRSQLAEPNRNEADRESDSRGDQQLADPAAEEDREGGRTEQESRHGRGPASLWLSAASRLIRSIASHGASCPRASDSASIVSRFSRSRSAGFGDSRTSTVAGRPDPWKLNNKPVGSEKEWTVTPSRSAIRASVDSSRCAGCPTW